MENNIIKPKIEINEYIQVYPQIKNIFDPGESQKYLYLFSQKVSKRASFLPQHQNPIHMLRPKFSLSNTLINKGIEKDFLKEVNKEKSYEKLNYYLINKDIQLRKNNSKRTQDIKHALETFLRESDLIKKITNFFEEYRENLSQAKKNKTKKKEKKDDEKKDDENEKHIQKYIESLIAKLADNVVIEKHKKNSFVVKMNDIGDNCYFLLCGQLSVLKPVEYHIELTYDEYMQYITNLLKNKEYEIIDNVRHINRNYIDLGLVQDLADFIKSYFIVKLNEDKKILLENKRYDLSFIDERLKLFYLSYEDYNLSKENIQEQIEKIIKGSLMTEKDLKEYFNKIFLPTEDDYFRLKNNPHILENKKKKVTVYKYEDFLFLKPGSFFGETALDSTVNKRNASIRTEEDCVLLSLKNDIYKTLLSDSNKKLKSFDVFILCKNFFFNEISPIIFGRRYFSLFKLAVKSKSDILYQQSETVSSIYFIKEGNIKLEINISMLDIYNSIKYYYEILTKNPLIKINQNELKEIKDNYLEDKNITDFLHQNKILKKQLKIKKKFELYSSNYFGTLGLEEFFLQKNYICSCTVISNNAKFFEISKDSLSIIIDSEKQIHSAYYKLIGRKLISLIKRLYMIKNYFINQLNYKIKENYFNTEMPKDQLIKGQTGEKRAFGKLCKKRSEPKFIRPTLNSNSLKNEEMKNNILFNLKKVNSKIYTRNKYDNMDTNRSNSKRKDLINEIKRNNTIKKFEKNKKNKNLRNNDLDKNNLINIILRAPSNPNFKSVPKYNSKEYSNEIEKEKEKETERAKRIMETTIIKIGDGYLSLKEIGKRVANTSYSNNSALSIVKNDFYKTYNNIFVYNSSVKNIKNQKIIKKDVNITVEPLSFKNNNMSVTSKNKDIYSNKLPSIPFNTFNNYPSSYISQNYFDFSKYNPRNRKKVNLFKMTRYSHKNNYKTFFNQKKKKFNVILTNTNPISKNRSFSNKKKK